MQEDDLDISNLISSTQDLVEEFTSIDIDDQPMPASASKMIQSLRVNDGRILYLSISLSWEDPNKNLVRYLGTD